MNETTKPYKMKQIVNKNLITLKCVLFCFLSGIGCIFPYLPLHMTSLGIDRGEARLISAVAPCVALLGPAVLGPLIDKLSVGRGSTGGSAGPSGSGKLLRVLTALCLILSAVFYSLLLAVPQFHRPDVTNRPQVAFLCNPEGSYVIQEACGGDTPCNRWEGNKTGVLAMDSCEYICVDNGTKWLERPFPTPDIVTTANPTDASLTFETTTDLTTETEEEENDNIKVYETNPPHLCAGPQCLVYMEHQDRLRVPLKLTSPEYDENSTHTSKWCSYHGDMKCQVPANRIPTIEDGTECRPAVRCRVLDPYDEIDTVLADAECFKHGFGDPTTTFWSYFVIRVLADIWPTAALALLGAACVIATRETSLGRGDVGRQLAFGTLGLAIMPPLVALAAEDVQPDTPQRYLVPFVVHAVFMLLGAVILLFDKNMPLSTPEWWWHTATGVLAMPMNMIRRYGAETAAIFAVVGLLGVLWSGIDAYLPWTVRDLNGTIVGVGLTMTAGAVPAIPALWWAEALVDYIGHSNVFITAFTFYCLRYTGLAYSTNYSWIVVCEILEVFTLSLVWVTAVLYFRHLVPRKYTATGQALPVIAHFCLGRCIGAIIGGFVSMADPLESVRDVYRGLGVLALLSAAVYLALYHLLLAPRCAAPAASPPPNLLQGLNANGASNGTYSPMRVYHEERSRKGHFRY